MNQDRSKDVSIVSHEYPLLAMRRRSREDPTRKSERETCSSPTLTHICAKRPRKKDSSVVEAGESNPSHVDLAKEISFPKQICHTT
jgi:hypothetical protein